VQKTVSVSLSHRSLFIKIDECSKFLVFATFKNPYSITILGRKHNGQEEKGQEKEAIGRLPAQP
jgi:hypothetical protein